MMFWDPVFDRLSGLVGAPADQLKVISAILFSYPLASIFVRLPPSRPNRAHLFSIIVSSFYLLPLLGLGTNVLHLVGASLGTYAIALIVQGPEMPWIAFIFVMGHLLINHFIRYFKATPATTIEISLLQMVLAQKLTTFAWNVHDGRQKPEDLDPAQLSNRISGMPSLLSFLGYCFFFPSVITGPHFEYATYDALVHHTLYQTPPPGATAEQVKARRKRVPHGRKRVAYLYLVIGLLFLGLYAFYGATFGYERILGKEWLVWGVWKKIGFVQVAGFMARTKYYAVWTLAEGACILTGVGFNGYDPKTGRTMWNRVRNIQIRHIESAQSFKVLFDSWNCRTNVWLRDCVYTRLAKKGKKPGSAQSMATFLTSAIWHGVDPGYYIAFVMAGVLTSLGRQFRHFVRPYFLPSTDSPSTSTSTLPKRIYDVLGWAAVQTNLNFIVSAFLLLSFKNTAQSWHRMGWYTPLSAALATGFFHFGGRRALRHGLKGKEHAKKDPLVQPELKLQPPSPAVEKKLEVTGKEGLVEDERDSKDLRWVKHALEATGEPEPSGAMLPDGGPFDDFVRGFETPALGRSREGSPGLKTE